MKLENRDETLPNTGRPKDHFSLPGAQHEGHRVHAHLLHHALLGVHSDHIAQRGEDEQPGAQRHEEARDVRLAGAEGEAEVRHLARRAEAFIVRS